MLEGVACKKFAFLKRDVELAPLYCPETLLEDKKMLLKRKIDFIEHRKEKLYENFEKEDELFLKTSLNQKFFDRKEQQDATFTIQNILMEAICMSELNDEILVEQQEGEDYSKLNVLFSLFTTLDRVMPIYDT